MSFKFRSLTIIGLLLSTQVWAPAQGQGASVMNIAAPSKGGVSRNMHYDFNVGTSGMVLNNSVKGADTTLAGKIAGNPNLQGKAATVILNEVVVKGGRSSKLQGLLEVGGTAARVIVANSNGIVCDGCGFLNATGVMLTTGRPTFNKEGELINFTMTSGELTVEGKGLKGGSTPRVDLVAYSLNLQAAIEANALEIKGGSNKMDFKTGNLEAIDAEADAVPSRAIFGSSITVTNGMRVMVTDAGVGVNLRGATLTSGGNMKIDGAGHLYLPSDASLNVGRALKVRAGKNLRIGGPINASDVDMRSGKQLWLQGEGAVTSAGKMQLIADTELHLSSLESLRSPVQPTLLGQRKQVIGDAAPKKGPNRRS